jgi:uncharacterized protein (DUF849 family)
VDRIIIEARVNELAPRDENPNVPFLPEEIARDAKACFDAGASILHYHGRGSDGSPDNSPSHYLTTNRLIREACPILLHPTLGYIANDADAETFFCGGGDDEGSAYRGRLRADGCRQRQRRLVGP